VSDMLVSVKQPRWTTALPDEGRSVGRGKMEDVTDLVFGEFSVVHVLVDR